MFVYWFALMALTLAIADSADGTGGSATISGATGGETVTVYSQTVDGELGTATWTSRGSRVGNGTVTLAAPIAYAWWRAAGSVTGADSNLVYQPLTNGTQAVLYRCLTAVQARIQGLALSGIASASVVMRKVPIDRYFTPTEIALPAIVVAPVGSETMNPNEGTNVKDDVGYPVAVAIFEADGQALLTNLDRHTLWREKIARAFRNQRLPGVTEVIRVVVTPKDIVDLPVWLQHTMHGSGLTIRATSREIRGI